MTLMMRLRRIWLQVHLWIAIGLGLLLVPIAVSGGLLMLRDVIEPRLNPARYALTGNDVALPLAAYLATAREAAGADLRPTQVRLPAAAGEPVAVVARSGGGRSAGPPRFVTVYLDPPTARVLDVADFRASFFGWLHRFHENLTVPGYGRQIVGWVGVGMLTLCLTGIWLWWPRNGALRRALRWRRGPKFSFNLHHTMGLLIALPLAAVSLTGIYLGFPQTGRQVVAFFVPSDAPAGRPAFSAALEAPALSVDAALAAAQGLIPGARGLTVTLPTERSREWQVELAVAEETVAVAVGDGSAAVRRIDRSRSAGEQVRSWLRWIHEGSHGGPVWWTLVFLTGLCPPVLLVTGVIMWLRRRRARRLAEAGKRGRLAPASAPAE